MTEKEKGWRDNRHPGKLHPSFQLQCVNTPVPENGVDPTHGRKQELSIYIQMDCLVNVMFALLQEEFYMEIIPLNTHRNVQQNPRNAKHKTTSEERPQNLVQTF